MEDDISILLDNFPQINSLFTVKKRVGHGTFSSVYLAEKKKIEKNQHAEKNQFAIKHIIPTSHPSRVLMELKCLKLLGGEDNIVNVSTFFRNLNHIVLVMPYFSHDSFVDLIDSFTVQEFADYILNLCIALKKVHSFNFIHRDIKPSNFLYSRKLKRYKLIDFGLSQDVEAQKNENQTKEQQLVSSDSNVRKKQRTSLLPNSPLTPSRELIVRRSPRKLSLPFTCYKENLTKELNQLKKSGDSRRNSGDLYRALDFRRYSVDLRRDLMDFGDNAVDFKQALDLKRNSFDLKDEIFLDLDDSPSKHTRLSSLLKDTGAPSGQIENIKSNERSKNLFFSPSILRRSPRKAKRGSGDFTEKFSTFSSILGSSSRTYIDRSTISRASVTRNSVSGILNSSCSTFDPSNQVNKSSSSKSGSSFFSPAHHKCSCYGTSKVCNLCLSRKNEHAPRAGTPGFRAPEVLMRHTQQTTAIDMWSVGIIMLCSMSARYPFFQCVDDLSSLCEITTLLGTKKIKKAADAIGKLFTSSHDVPALDLEKICELLRQQKNEFFTPDQSTIFKCVNCRQISVCICLNPSASTHSYQPKIDAYLNRLSSQKGKKNNLSPSNKITEISNKESITTNSGNCSNEENTIFSMKNNFSITDTNSNKENNLFQKLNNSSNTEYLSNSVSFFPPSAYNLLYKCLNPNPDLRIKAEDALQHDFFKEFASNTTLEA